MSSIKYKTSKVDKFYRITIPIHFIKQLKIKTGNYLKLELIKNNIFDFLYIRLPRKQPSRKCLQLRRKLPSYLINKLNINIGDQLSIGETKTIHNRKNPIIRGYKLDLSSLNLNNLMIETFTKNNEEFCRFWQSSKCGGRTKFIETKRFIKIDHKLGEFFGLFQAESRKNGEKFDFTNNFINEHRIFIDIVEEYFGISRNEWKLTIFYSHLVNDNLLNKSANAFTNETKIFPKNIYYIQHKTIDSICYAISIDSVILNKIMNYVLIKLREYLISNPNETGDFAKGFIIKYLLGDGTITVINNHAEIVLSECNEASQKDIIKILKLFDIITSSHGIKIDISTNFHSCMWFLENDLFIGHPENRTKFLNYLKSNFYIIKKHNRFSNIGNSSTVDSFAKINNISKRTAYRYLSRNQKAGFIDSYKINKLYFYKLSEKGEKFLTLMNKYINL